MRTLGFAHRCYTLRGRRRRGRPVSSASAMRLHCVDEVLEVRRRLGDDIAKLEGELIGKSDLVFT